MKKFTSIALLLLTSVALFAQTRTVTGVVSLKDTGEPEPGVNVVVTGTTTGTITDFDGNFSLDVPSGKSITISYIGYKSQTLTPKESVVTVVLEQDAEELDEVIAVGYGSMRKSDVVGSVSSISSEQLQKTPAANISQAMQGKAAGVTVNAASGQPGAPAEVRIRGIGSTSDSRPIYVVDGMILDDISFLSADDISAMEVLKDASATAIYGSRGANGVVLITTKKGGKDGLANISFNAYLGIQNNWKKLDLMNRDDMSSTLVGMQRYQDGGQQQYDDYYKYGFNYWLKKYKLGNSIYYPVNYDYSQSETDWQQEVFKKNALIQNYHLSVDGGSEKGSYAFSVSYFNQDGTIIGSNYERLSIRLNSDYKPRKWLHIGEDLSFMYSGGRNATVNNPSPQSSILSAALAMAPWDPTHYPDGSVNNQGKDLSGMIAAGSNNPSVVNPFTMVEEFTPIDRAYRWVGGVYIEILPIEGLSIKSSINMDLCNSEHKMFKDTYDYSAKDKNTINFLESNMKRYLTLINDNIITYSRTIQKHSFSVMVGESWQEYSYYGIGGSGYNIANPSQNNWYLSSTTTEDYIGSTKVTRQVSDEAARTRMLSIISRAFYGYDNRYLITATFRADASSKFANPWGFFPSVALAWRINQESFLKSVEYLDNLKLRFGWGRIGNEKVDQTAFTANMFTNGPTFVGSVMGSGTQQILSGAALLKNPTDGCWETTETWNVGTDFGFWNGMLSGTVEGFVRDTKDMLMQVSTPAHVGNLHMPWANVGLVRNAGVELTLEHRYRATDNFTYSINGNLSYIKNTLLSKNTGDTMYGDRTIVEEGLPLNTFRCFNYEGIYRTDEEAAAHLPNQPVAKHAGDAKYTDVNNDGKIDEKDYMTYGSPFPWLTYAFGFNAEFYGVDFQLSFQGVYGNQIYNALRERTEGDGTDCTLLNSMKNVWTKDNPNGTIPNPYGDAQNTATSSRYLEDGSYFRLKDAQIGYTLPKRITTKAHFNRVRFYVSASNLFTITKYTGYDPEVGLGGVDYGNYPVATTFLFGVNLGF